MAKTLKPRRTAPQSVEYEIRGARDGDAGELSDIMSSPVAENAGARMKHMPWHVKGIDPEAREVARDAARRSGLSVGRWLNSLIINAATTADRALPRDRNAASAASTAAAAMMRGKPLPPTPKSGQGATRHRPAHHTGALVTRSGRTVFISPAKSPNTINAWSKAFKK